MNFKHRIFTLANLISLSRILLMIPIFYVFQLESPGARLYLFLLMALAILTDCLDGLVARKLNQISDWGKIFDPVADKICIGIMVILLVLYRGLPLWFVLIVLGKDLLILLGALLVLEKQKLVIQSTRAGKWTSFVLSITVLAYTFEVEFIQIYLVAISTLMIGWTLVSYGRHFFKIVSKAEITEVTLSESDIRKKETAKPVKIVGESERGGSE
ncbi:CDP-alcohol phosphatidyltransferase family protein [candidate division KSB1 bacterium]|nr:CDP-alcohol phosphatidyltransferase family protein [candidate division KSB1 bacterium]